MYFMFFIFSFNTNNKIQIEPELFHMLEWQFFNSHFQEWRNIFYKYFSWADNVTHMSRLFKVHLTSEIHEITSYFNVKLQAPHV